MRREGGNLIDADLLNRAKSSGRPGFGPGPKPGPTRRPPAVRVREAGRRLHVQAGATNKASHQPPAGLKRRPRHQPAAGPRNRRSGPGWVHGIGRGVGEGGKGGEGGESGGGWYEVAEGWMGAVGERGTASGDEFD